MLIPEYIKKTGGLIEDSLHKLIPQKDVPYSQLYQAARYAIFGEGKRLRPILAIATAETLGCGTDLAMMPACALEMVHTYSLIHDDLPCMDDDDYRRGKPTLHKAFPEGHAVLTGDYLLTYAFELLAQSPGLNPTQKIQLIQCLAVSAGDKGMIAGQIMDIEASGKKMEMEKIRQIHACKTGALIMASIEFGAIVANATKNERLLLKKFGANLGLAFQIMDDLLDVTDSEQKHGKSQSSDEKNQKTTYATLLGLEGSQQMAQSLLTEGFSHLQSLNRDISILLNLSEQLIQRLS